MRVEELLEECEQLSYAERVKKMVALARQGNHAELLDALEGGNFYERWLALLSCYGDASGKRALRMVSDDSQLIHRTARALVARYGTDAEVLAALESTLSDDRRNFVRKLHEQKRFATIEGCIEWLAARPAEIESLVECLPHATEKIVRKYLPTIQTRMLSHHWARLSRLHPTIVLDELRPKAEKAERPDPAIALRARAVIPFLAERRPIETIQLVRLLARHIPLRELELTRLARRMPVPLTDLVLEKKADVPFDVFVVLPKLDVERAIALLNLTPQSAQRAMLSTPRRLSPALRDRIYLEFGRTWEDRDGTIRAEIVAQLSRELREQESRRHINLPALRTRPAQRLPFAAYLPWDEAMTHLLPMMQDSDPDLRNLAHASIAQLVRYQRERLPDLLALHTARKYEQDPIRLTMLNGLADLPPSIWTLDHLDTLRQIIRNALDAVDLSMTTTSHMQRLMVRLVPFFPNWSAEQLAQIVHERGTLQVSLHTNLSDGELTTLVTALLPILHHWDKREGWHRIVQFASQLGRRLRLFDKICARLETIVRTASSGYTGDQALTLIAYHSRTRLPSLVPALIAEDPSWATRPIVYTYLHARRQDLLTPFLGFRAYTGRFSTGRTRFVFPFANGFVRWTAHQQEIFAQVLGEILEDKGRDTPSYVTVMNQLAALTCPHPTALIRQAEADNPKPALMDAALRALGRLDGGQGIPTLIEALNDKRGRIAIYMLRGALLRMPKSRALGILQGVPMGRVTVAKEAVRLIGELETDEAYQILMGMYRRDGAPQNPADGAESGRGLHRDVKIALLRGLWGYLDRDESWQVLQEAATSPDTAIACHVARVPAGGLTPDGEEHLIGTVALLLAHPDARVRLLSLQRLRELPVSDRGQRLFPLILAAIGAENRDERTAAAFALFFTYTDRDITLLKGAVSDLLPNRRALHTLIEQLLVALPWQRDLLASTASAVLAILRSDPLTSCLVVRLAFQILSAEALIALLLEMAESRALHADALEVAHREIRGIVTQRRDFDLEALEQTLGGHSDRYVRRLGLEALVSLARGRSGWTAEKEERLESYRNDPAALVAEAAQFTFPTA